MKEKGYGINGNLTKEEWDTILEDLSPPPIYYRILIGHQSGEPVVATLQDFDECDYNHDRYLTFHKYNTEEEAERDAKRLKQFQRTENYNFIKHIPNLQLSAILTLLNNK